MEDPAKSFEQLTYYMLTVLLGIFIHAVIFLPTIYFFFTRRNPFKMALHMGEALLTAWGTASRYSASRYQTAFHLFNRLNYIYVHSIEKVN